MILSFDQAGDLLDQMAEEFPPEFYEELNGGISLLPEAKEDPEGEPGELYIMGEYCNDMMGKYINLYYGSFAALARLEDWTEEDWEDELYTTLAHEFTHHIEGRAGERGLEIKDEQFMEEFRAEREAGRPAPAAERRATPIQPASPTPHRPRLPAHLTKHLPPDHVGRTERKPSGSRGAVANGRWTRPGHAETIPAFCQ